MTFPAYWGPKDGPVILARSPQEIGGDWVQHYGSYNVQTGQWEPRDPLDHDGDGAKGGSEASGEDLTALRAAYKAKVGKKAFAGWDAAEIKARMSL